MNKLRAEHIELFKKTAEDLFAKTDYQSALLAVSQYWADEAGDAVHDTFIASKRARPVWPHLCAESTYDEEAAHTIEGEACSRCDDANISYMRGWDDNGDAVTAFEAWCHEAGSQEEPDYKNALPCLLAQRTPNGVEVSFVGKVERMASLLYPRVRDEDGDDYEFSEPGDEPEQDLGAPDPAWADTRALELLDQAHDDVARRVLADYLLEKGQARGELIATGIDAATNPSSKVRYDELLGTQLSTWFHPLGRSSPEETAVFDRGLLVACDLQVKEDDYDLVLDAPVLRSVEKLTVYGGMSILSGALPSLKQLGPIEDEWVHDLVAAEAPWAIERLHVIINDEGTIEPLAGATNLPKLRELTLSGEMAEQAVAAFMKAPWWKQLDRLTIADRDVDGAGNWQKRHRELGVPWLAVQQAYTDPSDTVGWEVAFGPDGACEATMRGFSPHATFDELRRMTGQTPFKPTLVASEHYAPLAGDLD